MDKRYKLILLAIFALLITSFLVVQTYALFETDASGEEELEIGKWIILLNNNDVTETETLTLSSFTYVNGSHTQSGYFAPGSTGYFDLEIDASESDVSVEYTLDIDDSALTGHPNIYFTVTDLGTNQTVTSNTYSGLIRLSDANRVHNIRISLIWNNQSPTYDPNDTSLIDGEMEFEITANFIQSIAE